MEDINSTPAVRPSSFLGISFPWIIALLGALLMLLSTVNVNTFGIFFKHIAGEFGWNRGDISAAFSLRFIVGGIAMAPVGYWADRFGTSRVLTLCFVLLGTSLLLLSRITALWQLFMTQGVLMGVSSTGPFICLTSTACKWHENRRGMALGIVAAGTGLSSVVFPPLATKLIEIMGWRDANMAFGVMVLVIAVPACLVVKDPPTSGGAARNHSVHRDPLQVWRAMPKFLKDRVFLAIVVSSFLFYMAGHVVLSHLVNYVTDSGISAVTAAAMMSVMGIASTAGRLALGSVSDRIGTRADLVLCFGSVGLSLVLLMLNIPALMWVAVAVFGVGFGGTVPLVPAALAEYFGAERLATLTGMVFAWVSIGNALGPWMGGVVFDVTHSYLLALGLSAAFSAIAVMIVLRMRRATSEDRERGQAMLG